MSNQPLGKVLGHGMPAVHKTTKEFSSDRRVGIELEVENVRANTIDAITQGGEWRHEHDGSLRDGAEFITRPIFGKELGKALDVAFRYIKPKHITWRCGLHVHVDIRDKSVEELHAVCSMYAVLERVMFAIEGNNRQRSRFTVPWYNQIVEVSAIAEAAINGSVDRAGDMFHRMGKYTALNLIPIMTQGSVEFRHALMSSDREHVTKWILLCQAIVDKASTMTSEDILMSISTHGPVDGIRSILGDVYPEMYGLPEFSNMIWQGVDVANLMERTIENDDEDPPVVDVCDVDAIVKRF